MVHCSRFLILKLIGFTFAWVSIDFGIFLYEMLELLVGRNLNLHEQIKFMKYLITSASSRLKGFYCIINVLWHDPIWQVVVKVEQKFHRGQLIKKHDSLELTTQTVRKNPRKMYKIKPQNRPVPDSLPTTDSESCEICLKST